MDDANVVAWLVCMSIGARRNARVVVRADSAENAFAAATAYCKAHEDCYGEPQWARVVNNSALVGSAVV